MRSRNMVNDEECVWCSTSRRSHGKGIRWSLAVDLARRVVGVLDSQCNAMYLGRVERDAERIWCFRVNADASLAKGN